MTKPKHNLTVAVIDRDPNGLATQWGGHCTCKAMFAAPTFEEVDDKYRMHIHRLTGKAPEPFGPNHDNRWHPAPVDAAPTARGDR